MIRLILQLRDRLPHNIRQQINQPGSRLHLGAVSGERKPVLCNLQQRDTQRPHIGGDGVGLALDPLGRHVVGSADEGVGIAFGAELAADAKVAEFDLAVAAEEDVGGFDVYRGGVISLDTLHAAYDSRIIEKIQTHTSVNNLAAVEVGQPMQHPLGNLAQDLFAGPASQLLHLLVDAVETAALAEFHGDRDGTGRLVHECSVVLADMI
jgi:hypothetical protein